MSYAEVLGELRARYDHARPDHREAIRVVDRALRVLVRMPPYAQDRVAAALVTRAPLLGPVLRPPPVTPLCPAYPRVGERWAARIVLGEAPTRLVPGLARREAHEMLLAGVSTETDAYRWLVRDLPVDVVRSVPVARWLRACWADPDRRAALEREIVDRGPHGEEIRGRLIDRVDEISTTDLARGPATSVREAFRSAARRAYERWERDHERAEQPLAPTPLWWRPIRCARLLMSAADLVAEGRAQRHCVGTYAHYVRSGRSVIVSICVVAHGATHRSTAELRRADVAVLQHKGARNCAPPPLCVAALEVIVRRALATAKGSRP